jgi:hypothetical protein
MTDPFDTAAEAAPPTTPGEPASAPSAPTAASEAPVSPPAQTAVPDEPVTPPAPTTTRRRPRARSLLAGLLLVLGSLSLVLSGVTVWAHQVLLDSDRYAALVATVSDDPAVIDAISTKVAAGAVTALDVQGRLEQVLPGPAAIVAGPIADQVEQKLEEIIGNVLVTPQFQTVWVDANRLLHAKVVAFLRGDTTVLQTRDGVVYLDVYPLIDAVLRQLQQIGIIPADAELPDPTTVSLSETQRALLERTLGVTLPADFAAIPLFEAAGLEKAQGVVQAFDAITIGSVLLTIVLLLGAIFLARRRRRMVMAVGLGAIVGLMLLSITVRGARAYVVSAFADPQGSAAVEGIFTAAIADLRSVLIWVAVAGLIVVIVAYLVGRPSWFELASSDDRMGWAADHLAGIRGALIAAIVFLLLAFIVDLAVALLLAALAGLVELALRNLREPVEA